MKKRNVFGNILVLSLAVGVILSAGIKDAWAYFTTYARAEGGYSISFGYETEIEEEVSDWTKTVVIKNKPGSQPVYIRFKAFCGEAYELRYSGSGWTLKDDGYWYYDDAVNGGSQTNPLAVKIENIPVDIEDSAALNVVVIYECTPVRYDSAGKPYADWTGGRN